MALGWKLHGDGKHLGPTDVVAPDERLSWGTHRRARRAARGGDVRRDVRLPADHGPEPPARDHDERHRDDLLPADRQGQGAQLPRHVSASSSAAVAAIRAQGGDSDATSPARSSSPASCSPLVGVLIHFVGSRRAAQGAAAGRHRRRRHADRLQPRAGRRQHLLAAGPVGRAARDDRSSSSCAVGLRGLHRPHRDLPRPDLRLRRSRGSSTRCFGQITSYDAGAGKVDDPLPRQLGRRRRARRLVRLPAAHRRSAQRQVVGWHLPVVHAGLHPARAAGRHRADRREHRPRQGGRRDDRRPTSTPSWAGRIAADGVGTVIATSVGGSPTTTYAENIGVMAATRVYSTAAYYVAAVVAILLRPLARSSARSSRRRPAACSAASRSCSTA